MSRNNKRKVTQRGKAELQSHTLIVSRLAVLCKARKIKQFSCFLGIEGSLDYPSPRRVYDRINCGEKLLFVDSNNLQSC